MIIDRDYQIEAVDSIWKYFAENYGNPIVAMPTGTGKSIVIARFLQSIYRNYPQQKVIMLTHVKELIQQNYEKLQAVWAFAPCGVYSAGLNSKVHTKPITFAGIQSVAKKWALFGHVDLVIIDEVHRISPNDNTMYQAFIGGLKSINPHVKIVGLTATPWRLGHGHIIDPYVKPDGTEEPSLFTDVCYDITSIEPFNKLIAEGYLIPLIPKKTETVLDTDGVHMRGGEFIEKELQTAVDKDEITMAALKEAMEIGHNRNKWLIFAAGTDHADHIAAMLNYLGISCGVVHSKAEDRDKTIADFKAGRIRAVVNNNILTTGFDDPGIDLIICLRPTASSVLWVQMLGRGTRPLYAPGFDLNTVQGRLASIAASTKQNCLVLDYAANTRRLGPINDPVVPKKKGQKTGEAPVKECPRCLTYVHATLRYCNGLMSDGTPCNYEFTFDTKLKQSASKDELIKGDMPIVKTFKVDHITYSKHVKVGAAPIIKVSYFCGLQKFDEYVCIEHKNAFAVRKAHQWWNQRNKALRSKDNYLQMPTTTDAALKVVDQLAAATHLKVWINKQYPEILSVCFDGTAFGTQEVDPDMAVRIEHIKDDRSSSRPVSPVIDNEEIPF